MSNTFSFFVNLGNKKLVLSFIQLGWFGVFFLGFLLSFFSIGYTHDMQKFLGPGIEPVP